MNLKRLLASLGMLVVVAIALPQAGSADTKIDDSPDPSITDGTAAHELAEARALWKSTGTRNYRFTISASCFCAFRDPVKVKVRGKKVTLSDPDWFGPKNVPQLFKVVRGAIDRKAALLQVKYSKTAGFPRYINIDYDFMIADEEIAYLVTGLRKIRPRHAIR